MKLLYYILICCIIVLGGCSKEETTAMPVDTTVALTGVDLAIANGEPMASILANFPLSEFYGKSYQGGLIFYVDSLNATGLVAIQDVNNDDPQMNWWYTQGAHLQGFSCSVGAGQNNTNIIVNTQGVGDYAAYYCDTLSFAGHSDWFMPSIDELSLMYSQIGQQTNANFQLAGYMSTNRDSVLVNTSPTAYQFTEIGIHFDHGGPMSFTVYVVSSNFFQSPGYVRPVRQFN